MNIELSETENHGVAFMMRYKANAVKDEEAAKLLRKAAYLLDHTTILCSYALRQNRKEQPCKTT